MLILFALNNIHFFQVIFLYRNDQDELLSIKNTVNEKIVPLKTIHVTFGCTVI